jgi:hypothetical protein
MLYFPQLSTGALVQFPYSVRRSTRTLVNEAADGSLAVMPDANASRTTWTLRYVGLSDNEAAAIEDLFEATQGQRYSFVFLEPGGNLFRWSEDLTESVWTRDAHVAVTALDEPEPPDCAVFSMTNTGQIEQGLSQVVPAPGDLEYTFSFYVRSATSLVIAAERKTTAGTHTDTFQASEVWQRFHSSGSISGPSESIRLSLLIPAGTTIEVCRCQMEAQPAPSGYKATYSQAGVYATTRFDEDSLRITSHGVNNHSARIRLTAGVRRD